MKIVALLAVRNSEDYMARCLTHLIDNGVEIFVIDNQSTDRTAEIAKTYIGRGVIEVSEFPYPGYYDWTGILQHKEKLAAELDADWFIHHDSDEIRESPAPWKTLREGIKAVDAMGYNAINFDEFVFVPSNLTDNFCQRDFVEEMRHYFYFHPSPVHRVNAWKNTGNEVDLVTRAGHEIRFPERRIYPINFILRHYICLSYAHANHKYCEDHVYSTEEIEQRGWHRNRVEAAKTGIKLPAASILKILPESGQLDRSDPHVKNLLFETPRCDAGD